MVWVLALRRRDQKYNKPFSFFMNLYKYVVYYLTKLSGQPFFSYNAQSKRDYVNKNHTFPANICGGPWGRVDLSPLT